MDLETALSRAQTLLEPLGAALIRPAPDRLDAVLSRERLIDAVGALQGASWGYLSAITGLDHPAPAPKKPAPGAAGTAPVPPAENLIEALYHFSNGAAVATLRVTIPYSDARLPSICGLVPSAVLYEQELAEMFGVTVDGIPVTGHLLLPDGWPAGQYPLRKSFTGLPRAGA